MPETIRTSGGDAHPRRCGFQTAVRCAGRLPARCLLTGLAAACPTFARAGNSALGTLGPFDRHELAVLVPMVGLIVFAVITAIMLVRARRRIARLEGTSREEITGQIGRAHV